MGLGGGRVRAFDSSSTSQEGVGKIKVAIEQSEGLVWFGTWKCSSRQWRHQVAEPFLHFRGDDAMPDGVGDCGRKELGRVFSTLYFLLY